MKKLISILLVFSLVFSFLLVACGGNEENGGTTESTESDTLPTGPALDAEKISSDPCGTIAKASSLAFSSFFEDAAGLYQTASRAMEKGSVSLSFSHESLLGDIRRITETIYMDAAAREYVSQTQVVMNRQLHSALLFFDREGLTFKGQAVLGSDKALELNFADLSKLFGESAAAELTGIGTDVLSLLAEYAAVIDECYRTLLEKNEEDAAVLTEEIGAILSQSISHQEGTAELLLSYRIENASLMSILDTVLRYFEIDEERSTFLREKTDRLLEQYEVLLRIEFLFDEATGAMRLALVQGRLKDTDGKTVDMDLGVRFTKDTAKLYVTLSANGNPYFAELIFSKHDDGGVISYGMTFDTEIEGRRTRIAEAEYVYDVGGGVKVTATMETGEEEKMDITLLGQITVEEDMAKIAFTSLSYKNLQLIFDASIIFTPDAISPEKPENAQDIVQMTEAEWNSIAEELKGSILWEMLFGAKQEVEAQ